MEDAAPMSLFFRFLHRPLIASFVLLGMLVPGPASAQDTEARAGDVRVTQAWARASVGRAGAAYVTLENTSEAPDRLISASTDVARTAALHTHEMEGDVMKMRPVEALDIPAKGSVTLEPGGNHIMLMGLKGKLVEGESFPLTLVFERSGSATVTVSVKSIAAMGPDGHGGMRGSHGSH